MLLAHFFKFKHIKIYVVLALIPFVSGCLLIKKFQNNDVAVVEEIKPMPQHSVVPITKPAKSDIRFAQSALKKLGYKVGAVDGIWGRRSSGALIAFEEKNTLASADGYLSELNMHTLAIKSGLSSEKFNQRKPAVSLAVSPAVSKGISQLLNKRVLLKNGPQLIILERNYIVMSKPNPYSSKLKTLSPGTAIYVIKRQENWYKIETLERKAGFIRVD